MTRRRNSIVGVALLAALGVLAVSERVLERTAAAQAKDMRRLRRPANEVIDDAIGWLAAADDSPFFVWVHLFDAHAPYSVPESFDWGNSYGAALAFMRRGTRVPAGRCRRR